MHSAVRSVDGARVVGHLEGVVEGLTVEGLVEGLVVAHTEHK